MVCGEDPGILAELANQVCEHVKHQARTHIPPPPFKTLQLMPENSYPLQRLGNVVKLETRGRKSESLQRILPPHPPTHTDAPQTRKTSSGHMKRSGPPREKPTGRMSGGPTDGEEPRQLLLVDHLICFQEDADDNSVDLPGGQQKARCHSGGGQSSNVQREAIHAVCSVLHCLPLVHNTGF